MCSTNINYGKNYSWDDIFNYDKNSYGMCTVKMKKWQKMRKKLNIFFTSLRHTWSEHMHLEHAILEQWFPTSGHKSDCYILFYHDFFYILIFNQNILKEICYKYSMYVRVISVFVLPIKRKNSRRPVFTILCFIIIVRQLYLSTVFVFKMIVHT